MIMQSVITSETSVNFYHTSKRKIPEDSHLHAFRREKLKCHRKQKLMLIFNDCCTVVYFDECAVFEKSDLENNPSLRQ